MLELLLILCFIPWSLQVFSYEFLKKVPPVEFCDADAKKNEVFFYLFKSVSQTTAIVLSEDYCLHEDDRKLPMKILIHGFTSNVTSPWYKQMKQAYFQKGSHNIVYVDWSIAGNKSFMVSAANIRPVGEYIADLIVKLKVPPENVHIIGHSLGSHLAGFVGKNVLRLTGKKVARITGTDPGGPGFENVGYEARLSKYDAAFVDVIHTDVGLFGIEKPIGHVDFYPNFGKHQPGCPSREADENCSHARSNDYFIESISKRVLAKRAKFDEGGQVVAAQKDEEVVFGDGAPVTSRGLFYLKTNRTSPFLMEPKAKKNKK